MVRLRTVTLVFFLFVCFFATFSLLAMQKRIQPLPEDCIQGVVLDLGNQPISSVPFMLYEGNSDINNINNCLYTSISNKSGHFFLPKPVRPGNYFLVAILDKEKLLLPTIEIAPKCNYLDLQVIYYASHPDKRPIEIVSKPVTPTPPVKQPIPTITTAPIPDIPKGTISGKIYLENDQILNNGTLELICENLEFGTTTTHTINIKNGDYELRDIIPGIYQFKASIPNYSPVTNLEMFILEAQIAQMDIKFQKSELRTNRPTNSGSSGSQSGSGQKGVEISVTVIDASWTPQIGAQVVLINRETERNYDGQTDENGEVILHNIPAGDYEVRAIFNGLRGRCELREDLMASPGKFVSLVLREIE